MPLTDPDETPRKHADAYIGATTRVRRIAQPGHRCARRRLSNLDAPSAVGSDFARTPS